MVVFDSSVLLLAIAPSTDAPLDPHTNKPLEKAPERIGYLIDTLNNDKVKIVIPTPVLSEVMVYAGAAGPKWLQLFNNSAVFRVASFDQKAAIEAALAIRDSLGRGGLDIDASDSRVSRDNIKFDRQIVAIAKAEGAKAVYSDDAHVVRYARKAGLRAYRTADLEPPPDDRSN